MLFIAFFSIIIVLCFSMPKFTQLYPDRKEIKEYATGYFMAMRAKEFCPTEFECLMETEKLQQTIAFIDIDFHDHS